MWIANYFNLMKQILECSVSNATEDHKYKEFYASGKFDEVHTAIKDQTAFADMLWNPAFHYPAIWAIF